MGQAKFSNSLGIWDGIVASLWACKYIPASYVSKRCVCEYVSSRMFPRMSRSSTHLCLRRRTREMVGVVGFTSLSKRESQDAHSMPIPPSHANPLPIAVDDSHDARLPHGRSIERRFHSGSSSSEPNSRHEDNMPRITPQRG